MQNDKAKSKKAKGGKWERIGVKKMIFFIF